MATAINRTARFRALSQRMAKAYGQLYLNTLPSRAREVMAHTSQQMQSSLAELEGHTWPAAIPPLLNDVHSRSDELIKLVSLRPTKESFLQVSRQSLQLLAAANTATEALEKQAQTPTARLVNLAGRQRMLSQRIAKNQSLIAAGWDSREVRDQIDSDQKVFLASLQTLEQTPVSTPAIRNSLELVRAQWVFFDAAIQRTPDARGLENVATTSERLLEVMDELTRLYENALKEVMG